MEHILHHDDDVETLEALMAQARLIRKRGTARSSLTAARYEVMLSKALDVARSAQSAPIPPSQEEPQ